MQKSIDTTQKKQQEKNSRSVASKSSGRRTRRGSFLDFFTIKRKNKKCVVKGLTRVNDEDQLNKPISCLPFELEADDASVSTIGEEATGEKEQSAQDFKDKVSFGPPPSFIGKAVLFDSENLQVGRLGYHMTISGNLDDTSKHLSCPTARLNELKAPPKVAGKGQSSATEKDL